MEQVELTARSRSVTGKRVKLLRREGLVPLVVYGSHTTSVNLQVEEFDLHRAVSQAGGQLIELHVAGEDDPRMVLARELQWDAITGRLLHVDLYEVDMTQKVRVEVQLELVGEPKLVASGQATVLQTLNAVEIECLPGDIVQTIEVDLTHLVDMDDGVFVRDLAVPQTVEILTSGEEMVAKLNPILEEEEEEEEEVLMEVEEVEVIQRGRAEDEFEEEG
jgi:large subunit ribosomal protein L25